MTVPLIILGFFSFVQWPAAEQLDRRLAGSRRSGSRHGEEQPEPAALDPGRHRHVAAGGRRGGRRLRGLRSPQGHPADRAAEPFAFTLAGRNDLYGDALNEAVFMRPGQQLSDGLLRLEDDGIDGAVNGTGSVITQVSGQLRKVQNGFVRSYALTMVLGAVVVGAVIALGRLG